MKNKVVWHEIILFAVVLFLILWKLLVYKVTLGLPMLWWLLGVVVGFLFIFLDRFVYSLVTHKDESLSMKIRDMIKKGQVFMAVEMLVNERQEQRELVMRSFLFIGVWVILGVFTVTSSVDFFARGFMLGIGTHLMFDLITDFVWNKPRFDLWFWQIKRKVADDEKRWFLGLSVLFYVLLASRL